MKKFIILIAVALSSLVAMADDKLYISDFTIDGGATKVVEMILENETAYCAFQTDVYLPTGLEIAQEDDEYIVDPTSRLDRSHTVSTNRLANGAIRVFVTSQGSKLFTGNNGAIVTLTLVAKGSAPVGRLALRGSVVVEENGARHQLNDTFADVNGGGGDPYDVNGDGAVNVGDVNYVLNLILQEAYEAVADVNADTAVNVGDVNAILANILESNANLSKLYELR